MKEDALVEELCSNSIVVVVGSKKLRDLYKAFEDCNLEWWEVVVEGLVDSEE